MATPSRISQRVRFGEFELDLSTRELWTEDARQSLAPQPFQVLQLLIERHGQLVTRDDLVHHLWPSDTFVDYEQGLKKAINRLRETLNDSAERPRFIETLPRQGYRFIAEVKFDASHRSHAAEPIVLHPHLVEAPPTPPTARQLPSRNSFRFWIFAAATCAVITTAAVLWPTGPPARMPKRKFWFVSQPLGYSPMLSSWSNNFDAMFYTDVMFQHAKASGAPDGVKTKRP